MTDQPFGQPAETPAAAPWWWTATPPWFWPRMRDVLTLLSTAIFAWVGWVSVDLIVRGVKLDTSGAQNLGQWQGAAITQWVGVMAWHFSSTRGSSQKDDTIAALTKSGS